MVAIIKAHEAVCPPFDRHADIRKLCSTIRQSHHFLVISSSCTYLLGSPFDILTIIFHFLLTTSRLSQATLPSPPPPPSPPRVQATHRALAEHARRDPFGAFHTPRHCPQFGASATAEVANGCNTTTFRAGKCFFVFFFCFKCVDYRCLALVGGRMRAVQAEVACVTLSCLIPVSYGLINQGRRIICADLSICEKKVRGSRRNGYPPMMDDSVGEFGETRVVSSRP